MSHNISDALAQLQRQFADQLPTRLQALRAQFTAITRDPWSRAAGQEFYRALHSLNGTAGTFGFLELSDAARQLSLELQALLKSQSAPSPAAWSVIEVHLNRLEALAQLRLASNAPSLARAQERMPLTPGVSPMIYLVEDDATQAVRLQQVLRERGYQVRLFTSLAEFRDHYNEAPRPAAIVMDMIFPDGDLAGAEVITEFKAGRSDCPPLIFASVRDDLAARLAAYRAGAVRYFTKPIDAERLVDHLDQLTGRLSESPYRVVLLDDDPLLLQAQAEILRQAGMEVEALSEPGLLLEVVRRSPPDVLILDVYMPEVSGPELAAVLREDDSYAYLPILFLSAETDVEKQLLALNLGGDDFLIKPVNPVHLVGAVKARAQRARKNNEMMARLERTLYEREREHLALNQHAIVSIADSNGIITYVNDKFCESNGYRRDAVVGQNHRLVSSGYQSPSFYREMWRTISSGNVWRGELCNRRKGGSLYWVDITITPFLDSEGKPYQFVAIATDITKIKENERALSAIVKGTSGVTGQAFFESAVEQLAKALGMHIAFIAQHDPAQAERLCTLAWWRGERIDENFSYPIHGTPCERVVERGLAIYPQGVADLFPEDLWLRDNGIDSYLAIPLLDSNGHYLGHMGALDSKPIVDGEAKGDLLRIFAARVAGEMERMAIEREMEMQRERLRRGQVYANIGTWEWNIRSGELFWTERIAPLFGYPVGELETSYANFMAAVHPDDREAVSRAVNSAIEDNHPYEIEHRVVWPDGTVRWLLERGAVVRDAEGNPLQMLGVVIDIHERKLAERELQIFRQIFESTRQGIGITDNEGRLLYANSAHDELHGYPSGETLGMHFTQFLAQNTLHWAPDAIMEAISAGQGWAGLLPVMRKDGSEVLTAANIGFIPDREGRPEYLFNVMSDYTPELLRQQQLTAAKEEAERASQAKSDFLSSMSHELRTPMNAILGFAQILEYDDTLGEEQLDSVHEILKAGHHLLALINEVLDLAKIEAGRLDLSLEPVLFDELVSECYTLLEPLAAARKIKLQRDNGRQTVVRADRVRLKQVLLNLLSNAIKYNRDGGTASCVAVAGDEGWVRIEVRDSGRGIPAARIGELFQPFNRLGAESGVVEGTGIGLIITRRLVELMGGRIDVASREGEGSTFSVELPADTLASHALQSTSPAERSMAAEEPTQRRSQVLYIEDNPVNLKLVSQLLARRPQISLLTAHTPQLGIELAMAHRPALILLDINMPEMDGYQVLKVLKGTAEVAAIPVIAVTANAMPHDIERGKEAGFCDYLTKPINARAFVETVERWLNGEGGAS